MDFVSRQYGLRRVAGKIRRRVKQLAGRPDNSPWILDPPPPRRTAHVDFVVALDYLSPNSRLMHLFHEAMGARGLSVLLVNSTNVHPIMEQIECGWLKPHVLVDLCSSTGNPFERLLHAAARHGVYTMSRPEDLKWTLKAQGHPALEQAGLPLPPTVILHAHEKDRELTSEERQRISDHCVIKPSLSGANRGVVVDVPPTAEAITQARNFNRQTDWLIQRLIRWTKCGSRPGYLRGYNVCGHRTLLWWCRNGGIDTYHALTWKDLAHYDLMPAVNLLDRVAEVTAMDFFSVEIAILRESGPDRFCLIDYVNDQCDLDPQAHPDFSPPEPFTRWACERLADFVYRKKHGLPAEEHRGLFLVE
ncbi:MAG: hypothetical protein ACM359_19580 [Bacillota bacterium]